MNWLYVGFWVFSTYYQLDERCKFDSEQCSHAISISNEISLKALSNYFMDLLYTHILSELNIIVGGLCKDGH